jgi:hypothetical protein
MRYDTSNIYETKSLSSTATQERKQQRRYRAQRVQGLHPQRELKEPYSLSNVLCSLILLFCGRVTFCEPIKTLKFRRLLLGTLFYGSLLASEGSGGGTTWGCAILDTFGSIRGSFGSLGTAMIGGRRVKNSLISGGESGWGSDSRHGDISWFDFSKDYGWRCGGGKVEEMGFRNGWLLYSNGAKPMAYFLLCSFEPDLQFELGRLLLTVSLFVLVIITLLLWLSKAIIESSVANG